MRVIETVRTSQCPRCGKPPTRCRCYLKKSIRQRSKCVFSYMLPKVADNEKLPANDVPSPQPLQLTIQGTLQETTTDDDTQLAENDINCPRCIINQKRSRKSPEERSGSQICKHCILRAQIKKLKADKRKSRLRSREDHDTKHTSKEDKLEIIYISKKRNQIALTESKLLCEEQDAGIKTPKETEMILPEKQQKIQYTPNELNKLHTRSTPTVLNKMQSMFQSETNFLTYNKDNKEMNNVLIAKTLNVSKASAFTSAHTILNLRQQHHSVHYAICPPCGICKVNLDQLDTQTTDEKLTESGTMSYRFPKTVKIDTEDKQISSSELVRRTREELAKKEKDKTIKEPEVPKMAPKEEDKVKPKPETDVVPKKKQKEDDQEKRPKEKEDDKAASKIKKEDGDADKKKKKDETDTLKELEALKKKKKEEEAAEKKKKAEEDAKKAKEEQEALKKQKAAEKDEADAAKKREKEAALAAKRKLEEETASKKMKEIDDDVRSREQRIPLTESQLMIYRLIKEHKVKKDAERLFYEEQDKLKVTDVAKKKQGPDKNKEEEEGKKIEENTKKRTLVSKGTATEESGKGLKSKRAKKDEAKIVRMKKPKTTEIIIGENIFESKLPLPPDPYLQEQPEPVAPLLFKKKVDVTLSLSALPKDKPKDVEKPKETVTKDNKASGKSKKDQPEATDGLVRYALSDRSFIDKGWTVLPVEEVVRKMNVYRMRPAQPEFDWFERNKNKRYLNYDTGEKLAVFEDNGRCCWYYKNGRLALDYYNSEELHSQHRFVVYSNGEPDERGRSRPYTVLATFSHLGTGVVFDHGGKIRLKYNQTEGVLLDREIGPVTTWKWHSLNDPPVLQQVMKNAKLSHKDQRIIILGEKDDPNIRKNDPMMIEIEHENSIKEMRKKQSLEFKPFQIKTKVLKINENFSLKVLDQATIYLVFREGSANIKLNIGMVLDHHEIVDTDTAALGVVSNCVERFPAATDSIAALQRSVERAQRFERNRTERERLLRPPPPGESAERLLAGLSRPLKVPLRTLDTTSKTNVDYYKCSRKPSCNLYYNSRLP